jgi:hypothetical protein
VFQLTFEERVYLYASKRPGPLDLFAALGCSPGDLPTGVIVGSVEIVGCSGSDSDYAYYLVRTEALSTSYFSRSTTTADLVSALQSPSRYSITITSMSRSRSWKESSLQSECLERRIDVFEMNVERAKTIDFRR